MTRRRRSPGMVQVTRLATCKRCGDEQVAWVQNKAGKWYLVAAYKDGDQFVANRFDWHRCAR